MIKVGRKRATAATVTSILIRREYYRCTGSFPRQE
jgi:hypothetical protein